MKLNRLKRAALLISILLAVACFATGLYWVASERAPSQIALDAANGNSQVAVTSQSNLITFEPIDRAPAAGFVFYPGANVDPRSYAPLLREIAAQGYLVAVPFMPLNIPFLRANAASDVISQHPGIDRWVIGGHSLGGVVAARYAAEHPTLEGLVLWASYPAESSLRGSDTKVLSVFGSEDGLTTPQDIELSRSSLPESTLFVEITGGNHAQFGSYGAQQGDNPATIPSESQWAQTVAATTALLRTVSH
jgi:pimeloyl-ACP methyl ester carboxylesterase